MDPTSFTKTSFCGKEIDNITENEAKQYILNQMNILCSGIQYKSRYAKVYNEQYSKNLRNPHIVCLKSSGTPYLLFLTQINDTNYCFLIDKKVKEGYDYPKIFILPFHFHGSLFQGSLYECELLRDREKKWSILIGDCYYHKGKTQAKTIVMDRVNRIHQMVSQEFTESEFTKTCPLRVKKYFDYKDISAILEEFVPNLSHDIRGLYFVPLRCSYSKILYLFPRSRTVHLSQVPNHKGTGSCTKSKSPNSLGQKLLHVKAQQVTAHQVAQDQDQDQETFRIMKTMKPDVYELYGMDDGNLSRLGLALVQTAETSQMLCDLFEGQGMCDEVKVKCRYNQKFKKWQPISKSQSPISLNESL